MQYAVVTVWHERQRYLPAILAIAFSALMAAMPSAVLLGLIRSMTLPIDVSTADFWVMHPHTVSIEQGKAIPAEWAALFWRDPCVQAVEPFVQSVGHWTTMDGRNELVVILGCSLEAESAALVSLLTPHQRRLLSQTGGVLVGQGDRERLGCPTVGMSAQVNKRSVHVVGWVSGMPSLVGPYVICSLDTARMLARMREDQTTFLMIRCRSEVGPEPFTSPIRGNPKVLVESAERFAQRSKAYWTISTNAGAALAFMSLMGMAVGVSIVSQSLYSAMTASRTQFAVLRALGTPTWRIMLFAQQVGILATLAGVSVSVPLMLALCQVARWAGTNAVLPNWLVLASVAQAIVTSLVATTIAMQSARRTDPGVLLH